MACDFILYSRVNEKVNSCCAGLLTPCALGETPLLPPPTPITPPSSLRATLQLLPMRARLRVIETFRISGCKGERSLGLKLLTVGCGAKMDEEIP